MQFLHSAHLLALSALMLPAVAQTTWYVDVNATPPGSGTQADPYASIQYAIDQASTVNGDTLLVGPGTYVEQVHTHGKLIILKSSDGPLATTITAHSATKVVNLGSNLTSGAVLEGFSVTGSGSTFGVVANSGTIRRCLVYGVSCGIRSDYDCWVEECTITGNDFGIFNTSYAGCSYVSNSIVWGNGEDLLDATGCSFLQHSNFGGADPGFWDAASLDLRLRPGSTSIDAGDPAGPHDPDGSVIDLGALTYDSTYAPPPTAYCTAKTNSLGCIPAIGAVGTASASGSPFTITCVNELSHKVGLLFYGLAPKNAVYQGGYLCVQSPVHRTGLIGAGGTIGLDDCSGVYSYDFGARIQSGTDPALVAGAIVFAQFWSRDPAANFTSVRSDGLRFGIAH